MDHRIELAAATDATREELIRARHLPGGLYASPEIYRRELERYFLRDWLYMGRVEQFAKAGDYEARRVLGRPVLLARNPEGELGAFYNMCRHRGVEVAEGRGNTRLFRCPYHGWTYDLSGRLRGAAHMRDSDGFDPATCRLPRLPLEVWRGNVFVSFAAEPPPFAATIAEFEKDFALLHTENCRLADVARLELNCNWKFMHENLMDFYHVNVLHAKTFGARFAWTTDNVALKDDGGLTIRYDAAPSTPGGEALFGKAPWLADRPHSFACTGFMPPNTTLFGRIDCVKIMVGWPLGPDRCEMLIYLLFPESFLADPEFERKRRVYTDYQAIIYEEDRSMIESMQRAMALPVYEPGRLSVMEKPIHHFLNGYLDRMFGPER